MFLSEKKLLVISEVFVANKISCGQQASNRKYNTAVYEQFIFTKELNNFILDYVKWRKIIFVRPAARKIKE